MKIMLRWRFIPLNSFLGYFDLKTGVSIVLLFAVLNKVAGVYGLIAVLTGAGGSAAQLTMYIYSVIALVGFAWAMKVVSQEDPRQTLYFAHLFFADHIFSTSWTAYFAVNWWHRKHDGSRDLKSPAQDAIAKNAGVTIDLTYDERVQAALGLWNKEKGHAAAVILCGWLLKFFFAYLIYSYAYHLRKNSYRSLPSTRSSNSGGNQYTALPTTRFTEVEGSSALGMEDEDELELDYYRGVPSPRNTTASTSTRRFKQVNGGLGVGSAMGGGGAGVSSSRRNSVIAALGAGAAAEGEVLFDGGGDDDSDAGQVHR